MQGWRFLGNGALGVCFKEKAELEKRTWKFQHYGGSIRQSVRGQCVDLEKAARDQSGQGKCTREGDPGGRAMGQG